MRWTPVSRSVRTAGPLAFASAALLALAACQAPPQVGGAGFEQTQSPYQETVADQKACSNPKNVWKGRMTSLANAQGNGGAGTGQSVVSCFPTRQACHNWLNLASGAANGIIVEDRCSMTAS
ncbi:hypothetical protein ACRC7T_09710 [Segnochrobactraceae bacterium EtOH-i3]